MSLHLAHIGFLSGCLLRAVPFLGERSVLSADFCLVSVIIYSKHHVVRFPFADEVGFGFHVFVLVVLEIEEGADGDDECDHYSYIE